YNPVGVIVLDPGSTGNLISSNAIYGNSRLGIDLGNDGVTANTGAEDASLPNLGMNDPVITGATLVGNTLTLTGDVGSAPGESAFAGARVEFFLSDNDPSGHGGGRVFLGALTADANGDFSGSLTVSGVAFGDQLTGTATDASNNTSEFGPNAVALP